MVNTNPPVRREMYEGTQVSIKVYQHEVSGQWHWNWNCVWKGVYIGFADPAHLTGYEDANQTYNAAWNAARKEIDRLLSMDKKTDVEAYEYAKRDLQGVPYTIQPVYGHRAIVIGDGGNPKSTPVYNAAGNGFRVCFQQGNGVWCQVFDGDVWAMDFKDGKFLDRYYREIPE